MADADQVDGTAEHTGLVCVLRGQPVVLDAAVAEAFRVETRQVNQSVARNPLKFTDAHSFQLTEAEAEGLRAQGRLSRPGRGGSRVLPRAFTQKGVARLATVITSPAALEATDLIIDVFLQVHEQLARGDTALALRRPSRLRPAEAEVARVNGLRRRLIEALHAVLDTVVDPERQTTVADELDELGRGTLDHVRARLASRGLENEKIAAETALVLEQVRAVRERTRAEVRRTDAEADSLRLDNLDRKIAIVERLLDMTSRLEPNALVELYQRFLPAGAEAPSSRGALAAQDRLPAGPPRVSRER